MVCMSAAATISTAYSQDTCTRPYLELPRNDAADPLAPEATLDLGLLPTYRPLLWALRQVSGLIAPLWAPSPGSAGTKAN
jgi:hypothetical protein